MSVFEHAWRLVLVAMAAATGWFAAGENWTLMSIGLVLFLGSTTYYWHRRRTTIDDSTTHDATLMFIDVTGFSQLAERQDATVAYAALRPLLRRINDLIALHGGRVDRTLGDGLLAVFSSGDRRGDFDHAGQAIQCALGIQRENAEYCIESYNSQRPVLPLRIGINTSKVVSGNLGTAKQPDQTVIGAGVNLAKRLETVCDDHRVLCSGATIAAAGNGQWSKDIERTKLVRIKHHDELQSAVELDPFFDQDELREEAIRCFRLYFGLKRHEPRWRPPTDQNTLAISTDQEEARLVDFSLSGLCLKLPRYFARGVTVPIHIDDLNGTLKEKLAAIGIEQLQAQVMWSRPAKGEGFIHGLKTQNLSEQQLIQLFDQFRQIFSEQQNLANAAAATAG